MVTTKTTAWGNIGHSLNYMNNDCSIFLNIETIDLLHTELYPKAKQTNHNCKTVILVPHMCGWCVVSFLLCCSWASCLTLEVKEVRCYEMKIEVSEKAGSHHELNPGQPLAWVASPLDSWWLHAFSLPHFHLITSLHSYLVCMVLCIFGKPFPTDVCFHSVCLTWLWVRIIGLLSGDF